MIQNLAYCALVEDQMGTRVPYGLVIYAGHQVRPLNIRMQLASGYNRWSPIFDLPARSPRSGAIINCVVVVPVADFVHSATNLW